MKYFSFREVAIGHPSNRGTYMNSKEVMNLSFLKENRFRELWTGMYIFKTVNPEEGSAAFGNFYLEIDDENFLSLRLKMLTVTDYLWKAYKIRPEHMNFFLTNRSIWLSIPTKVFGCFGKPYLHKIHKVMAEEINQQLLSSGFSRGLDLSIYRWNGLMRGLGSYLPASKRWVTKFSLSDLEDSYSFEQLSQATFDNGFTFEDVQELPSAVAWFKKAENKMWKEYKQSKEATAISTYQGMENFINKGELPFNRNLHIYSTALYLKGQGFTEEEAFEKILSSFKDNYTQTNEAQRTIRSAYKGNKHFSPKAAQDYLDSSIYTEYTNETKKTFIVPRLFIQTLHSIKAHYQTYKFLFEILYAYQIKREAYTYDLTGHKYKKQVLGYFEKLKKAGFISYTQNGNIVEAFIKHQSKEVYQSYIVVPNSFLEGSTFKNMKREFILYVELWKSGLKTNEDKAHYFVNIKMETLQKRLGMTKATLYRYFAILKKQYLFFFNYVSPTGSKKLFKEIVKKKTVKKNTNFFSFLQNSKGKKVIAKMVVVPFKSLLLKSKELIIKCNYSP